MKNIINLIKMQFSNLYSIKKNLIIMAIIAIFLAFTNAKMISYIGCLYIMMTCYTVVAYEEKSKNDYLVRTLPIQPKDYILSKFIFIGLNTIIGGGLTSLIGLISSVNTEIIKLSLVTIISMGVIAMTIIVPLALTLGFEKGRFIMLILMILPLAISTELISEVSYESIVNKGLIGIIGIILALVMMSGSYFITSKAYTNKEI